MPRFLASSPLSTGMLTLALIFVPGGAVAQAPPSVSDEPIPVASVRTSAPEDVGSTAVEVEPPPVEITVAGSRIARAPGSAQVIGKAQLERFEYDDPHAVLTEVPGVYVRQEDGMGLRPNIGIRGGNPDRSKKVTLLEDGVLFGPAPYSAPAAYYFPLLTRMTAIQVVKGPAAVAYGPQTVGGAINLVTRPIPSGPSGGVDLGLGAYGYQKGHGYFGTSNEQFGFLVEGVRLHNTGFKELPDGADTGFTRNEWMVKTSYALDPAARVTHDFGLKLTYSDEVSNETYLGLADADFRENPNRRYVASALDQMRNHRSSLVFSHTLSAPESRFTLTTRAYRHDYARTWRKLNRFRGASVADVLADPQNPANAEYYAVLTGNADSVTAGQDLLIGPNDRRFVSQGLATEAKLDASTGPLLHHLEAGARLHNDSIVRHHSERAYAMLEGELVPIDMAPVVTTANRASTTALAVHALNAMTYADLTLTPGLRVEVIDGSLDDRLTGESSQDIVFAVMPGLGSYYSIIDSLGVLAGVYRGFSPPPPGGGAEPEYSLNYEAGARASHGASKFEVIGFFNEYSNLTNICTFSGGCVNSDLDRQFDAGRAHVYGVEAYVTHRFDWGEVELPLTTAYTYSRGNFESSFISADPIYGEVEAGDELPYLPRHQANATLGVEWTHAGASAAVTYVSPMREEAGSGSLDDSVVTDDLVTVDVGSKIMPLEFLTIYGNIRNLLDTQRIVGRRPYGARPNAPRWVQVGVKLEF